MSCSGDPNCTCGCCSGISVQTPQGETNAARLPAIAYRTGTWATFKNSMLARLSSSDYPALAGLMTRDDNDFSIALLDASAVMLDILTFQQERLANESYLRTASQLYSLTRLSQLIGYQPSPGVSASTYLAFTLSAATGLPTNPGTTAITIPAGTTVQSVPAQGQTAQSFQTSADILGKPDWNALPVQTGVPWIPKKGQTSVYLQGTATQLQPGDAFLIVGDDVVNDPTSPRWDLRVVSTVQTDAPNQRTLVTWTEQLATPGEPAHKNPKFYAMRQRASLFGYNAINPQMLAKKTLTALQTANLVNTSSPAEWVFGWDSVNGVYFAAENVIDLDSVYAKITVPGWVALISPDADVTRTPAGFISIYYIQSVTTVTRSDYGMSGKITRVCAVANSHSLTDYYAGTRTTSVLAQSDALPTAEQPLDHPLYGPLIDLEVVRQDLAGVTAVAIVGKRQKLTLNAGVTLQFRPDDGTAKIHLSQGDTLTILQPPNSTLNPDGTIPDWATYSEKLSLLVADSSGRSGSVTATLSQFTMALATTSDPVVQEFALVTSIGLVSKPFARTRLVLQNPLQNCYDRTATSVNANVGLATGGSPVTELLGSGSASTPNQTFTLKQSPLTYVQAVTPSGSQSSLQVMVNGAAWAEEASLYDQSPSAQVFDTTDLPGGTAIVQFGDGVEGATLPTGQNNIIANYRVGIGAAGNVAAGSITTLVDRPMGVSGVHNPMAATGGQDAQSVDDIKANAPLSVLTLGRAVSITDYQNLAANFAGIAKAFAIWIPNGVNRGVFLTVAAAGGAQLQAGNPTLAKLISALKTYGNPNVAIYAQSFFETLFTLKADIAYDPAYDSTVIQAAVLALLNETYSFEARTFGQGVSGDEIAALIQSVEGVVAVNVTSVKAGPTSSAGDLGSAGYSVSAYNNWISQQQSVTRKYAGPTRICPYIPVATIGGLPQPAEILVIDPDPSKIVLGVMK
jgi:Baseplate J-like protein